MENFPSRLSDVAAGNECCCTSTRGSGSLQNPSLLTLRSVAPSSKAADRFRAAAFGKNAIYIATIRTCGQRASPSAGRQQRKCRGQLLVGAHVPGAGG